MYMPRNLVLFSPYALPIWLSGTPFIDRLIWLSGTPFIDRLIWLSGTPFIDRLIFHMKLGK